jgi:hypothetical protein
MAGYAVDEYEDQMRAIQRRHHVAGRECGECTACCIVLAVGELEKPSYTPCTHCTTAGCGIYTSRPFTCRGWSCEWWLGRLGLSEVERPDKLGLMFTFDDDSIIVYETWPGAALTEGGLGAVRQVKSAYAVKFNPAGCKEYFALGDGDVRDEIEHVLRAAVRR